MTSVTDWPDRQTAESPIASGRWIGIALTVAAVSALLTTSIQALNSRVLVSWHGFLHTAIANRFPGPFRAPENPFFAGERLPYYWFHQYLVDTIARAVNVHPIEIFAIVTAAGLVVLWVAAAAIGVRRFGSLRAGLLIGVLMLGGVNPLGPLIAGARFVVQGNRLFTVAPSAEPVSSVFVSDHESEALMVQPLLPALYLSADWRRGQNVNWYLDNSSRGLSLALILPLLFVLTRRTVSRASLLSAGLIGAAVTAMSPLIGLAAVGSLLVGCVVVAAARRRAKHAGPEVTFPPVWIATAACVGAVAMMPTYYHLFFVGGSGATLFVSRETLLRAAALALNVALLLPAALWASLRASDGLRDHYRALLVAAGGLLFAVLFISLPDDTEHNLANTAQCLLVLPAVAPTISRGRGWLAAVMAGLCLPMMLASVASYVGRPSLPVAFDRGTMHRPANDPLEHLYRWIRASTSHTAVFIVDPTDPVKMSGNVSELPAFTARTLFTDHESYLTTPHKDFERRRNIATRLARGLAPSEEDVSYVASLRRPMYVLSYRADQPELVDRFERLYGKPVFHEQFVAVFAVGHRLPSETPLGDETR